MSGFDWIAPYYDNLSRIVFGRTLLASQLYFLDRIDSPASVLVLGGGTGRWLKEFLQTHPACKIYYVEASVEMLKLAREATEDDNRITFKLATEGVIEGGRSFDAVITFCFLDIFSDRNLEGVIKKIKHTMKPDAIWLVADFVETKRWHSIMLSVMYLFFRITTGLKNMKLPAWEQQLREQGFAEIDQKMFYQNFIKSSLYKIHG